MKLKRNQSGGLAKYRLWDNRKGARVEDDGIKRRWEVRRQIIADPAREPHN